MFNEEKINNRIDELVAMEKGFNIAKEGKYETFLDYIKSKEILFTAEDGKGVYNGDKVFLLCTKTWHKSSAITAPEDPFSDDGRIKYFSTEKAREEYILMNKPSLSLNDIYLIGRLTDFRIEIGRKELKELAKSKL